MINRNKYGGRLARTGKGPLWQFIGTETGAFSAPDAEYLSRLYFPLMNSAGLKSWVNPQLKGDVCASFSHYLTPPLVTEEIDKTLSSRNIWVVKKNAKPWSATGMSAWQRAEKYDNKEQSEVIAEPGVFRLKSSNEELKIASNITVFAPQTKDKVELIIVEIENTSNKKMEFGLVYSIPMFARHADNFRDHRQVTTMFQKVRKLSHGVVVKPNIVHDEHGHRANKMNYMVIGADEKGNAPKHIWLSMQDFTGEGGSLDHPESIFLNTKPSMEYAEKADGKEAIGAFKFDKVELTAGEKISYIICNGISLDKNDWLNWLDSYGSQSKIMPVLRTTISYWQNYIQKIKICTADSDFDQWVKWVVYQVKARQEFGNSFLPDFSYGRGGRGWRDLWQDLLSVLLVDPGSAKKEIINNYNGIRVDGSNATIIGSKPGEFIADRNNVARSWSDHGTWPVFVTNFYLNQSGDFKLLLNEMPYWKDQFISRSKSIDESWESSMGYKQLDLNGNEYKGSVLEHLLIQQLSAFYNVGIHNILKLEGADWNDTYDMARENGESVGFYAFYAHNLVLITEWLEQLQKTGLNQIMLLDEISLLLDRIPGGEPIDYKSPVQKQERLAQYFKSIQHHVSGRRLGVFISDLIQDLNQKSEHIFSLINQQEWIQYADNAGFFNGHYDNLGKAIGVYKKDRQQIDLTAQVMTIMNKVAEVDRIPFIKKSIDELLKDKGSAGIRLCRPFPELDLNLGRLTGFVYGHKEHGSKWLQQNVMLAYALYSRQQTNLANEIIFDVFKLSTDSSKSKVFPGIPSYLEPGNRGAYAWLTGSSAWMVLSIASQMFGVRGEKGDLCIEPQLSLNLFNEEGKASIQFDFQGKRIRLQYFMKSILPVYEFKIGVVNINEIPIVSTQQKLHKYVISVDDIQRYCTRDMNEINIYLQKK